MGNLRSLQPKSAHQTFLTEQEYIDALVQRRGREGLGHPCINYDQTRCGADLPTTALAQIIERCVGYEKHRVTEFLNTSLKAIGNNDRVVIGNGPAVNNQSAVPVLCANYEAPFVFKGAFAFWSIAAALAARLVVGSELIVLRAK